MYEELIQYDSGEGDKVSQYKKALSLSLGKLGSS